MPRPPSTPAPRRRARTRAALVALGLLAGACASPPKVDPTPPPPLARVDAADLDSVVLLYDDVGEFLASGVVVAPDRVLTAHHFAGDLPTEDGALRLSVDGRPARARILASGRGTGVDGTDADGDAAEEGGDWSLLALERSLFDPRRVARLHAPALEPDWAPGPGLPVVIAGFGGRFFPEGVIDVALPPPALATEFVADPQDLTGLFARGDGQRMGGMSGGGVFVRTGDTGAPELVGLFVSVVPVEVETTHRTRFLGIPVSSSSTRREAWFCRVERLPAEWLAGEDPNPRAAR